MKRPGEIVARHFQTGQPLRLVWQDGLLIRVEPVPHSAAPIPFIAPGLVDLQINGYAGVDFQQDNVPMDELLRATRALRRAGCTRFFLTLITDDWPRLLRRLRHFRSLRAAAPELSSAIAGWHVEGPFLSAEPGFHGAHEPRWMRDPTRAHLDSLREVLGSDPLLLTLAPERPGALDAIEYARQLGAVVSLGHTDASLEQLRAAVDAGATGFTHLANGIPRLLDRHDNILWRVFETRGLTVSLIPDKIHVSPQLFRLIHRIRPSDPIYYTTDAMTAAGAPPGRYSLGHLQLEVGEDQIVREPGKSNFAGSALSPCDGVFRAAEMLQTHWSQAWTRFSETPAQFAGLSSDLAPGAEANFCLIQTETSGDAARPAVQCWYQGEPEFTVPVR